MDCDIDLEKMESDTGIDSVLFEPAVRSMMVMDEML